MFTTPSPLFVIAALALTSCAPHPPDSTARELSQIQALPCYLTEGGIEVRSLTGRCPDRSLLEAEAIRFLGRVGASPGALSGIQVTFVDDWMDCAGVMAFGCSLRGDKVLLTMLPEGHGRLLVPAGRDAVTEEPVWRRVYDWRDTLVHELGHVIRVRARLDPDETHQDRYWWSIAENRASNRPVLDKSDGRAMAIRSMVEPSSTLVSRN